MLLKLARGHPKEMKKKGETLAKSNFLKDSGLASSTWFKRAKGGDATFLPAFNWRVKFAFFFVECTLGSL